MKKSGKILLITGLISTVLGLCLMGAGVLAADAQFDKIFSDNRSRHKTALQPDFESIDIKSAIDSVELLASEDGTCFAELYEGDRTSYDISIQNSKLTIRFNENKKWYDYITIHYTTPHSLKVFLPKSSYQKITIDTGVGDIKIDRSLQIKEMDIRTGVGNITVPKAKLSDLNAGVGKVTVLESNHAQSKTDADSQTNKSDQAEQKSRIRINTGIGDITVPKNDEQTDIHADSGIGDIKIQ